MFECIIHIREVFIFYKLNQQDKMYSVYSITTNACYEKINFSCLYKPYVFS